jgi:hypothetical protein
MHKQVTTLLPCHHTALMCDHNIGPKESCILDHVLRIHPLNRARAYVSVQLCFAIVLINVLVLLTQYK